MRAFESQLEELQHNDLFRDLRVLDSAQGPEIRIGDETLLNFSSNDYLGLANSPTLREAFHTAIDIWGTGSGASRLVSGTLAPHRDLEAALAAFKGAEAALTFSTGYTAAVGTLGAILTKGDVVILDKLSHACLIDAARLSGATLRVFPHNHLDKLEDLLRKTREKHPPSGDTRVLVVTESVFSMDGDRAPLAEIVALKEKYDALLLLDEAHALGVLGPGGRGLAEELGLSARVDLHMGTLSKGAGVSGGYLCASRPIIDTLINHARSFIFSTAPPPAVAATARRALEILGSEEGDRLRERLWSHLARLQTALDRKEPLESAILPWIVGEPARALELSQKLRADGFLVPAIRYPTVARDAARLRITLSAAHTAAQVDALAAALREP